MRVPRGALLAIRDAARVAAGGRPFVGIHETATGGGNKGRLTPRQEQVLLHCARRGYYEIPRRNTLRTLARELGISAPSLSLILRRAEAKLVLGFALGQAEVATSPLR